MGRNGDGGGNTAKAVPGSYPAIQSGTTNATVPKRQDRTLSLNQDDVASSNGRLPSHANYSSYDVAANNAAAGNGPSNVVYATYAGVGGNGSGAAGSNASSLYYDADPVPSEHASQNAGTGPSATKDADGYVVDAFVVPYGDVGGNPIVYATYGTSAGAGAAEARYAGYAPPGVENYAEPLSEA